MEKIDTSLKICGVLEQKILEGLKYCFCFAVVRLQGHLAMLNSFVNEGLHFKYQLQSL